MAPRQTPRMLKGPRRHISDTVMPVGGSDDVDKPLKDTSPHSPLGDTDRQDGPRSMGGAHGHLETSRQETSRSGGCPWSVFPPTHAGRG